MADEIRQKMSFDVADAIANIDAMQKRVSALSRSLGTLAKRADTFNRFGTSASQSLDSASRSFDRFGSQTKQASRRAADNVQNLTVSFETLARVVATQVVVRAMSALQRSIQDSISDFIEFDKAIQEINTIGASVGDTEFFSGATRRLPDQFNIPLLEAARGTYQALSNQILQTADDVEVLDEIALFSQATNSSFAASVDLLSGALNGYSLATSRADNLASQFFKTIELGKVRADELTTAFGRVQSIGVQLGITTAELNAGIATLTIGGIKASEAATQLRGIMTALVKPTVAMQEAFTELGFESAESLIASRGFIGSLQSLLETTDGTTRGIAKLFENVRGLSGGLSLGKGRIDQYVATLRQIENVDQSLSRSKGLEVLGSQSQSVAKVANQLSNAFTADVGKAIVDIADGLFFLTDGSKGLINAAKVLIPQMTVVAAGLAALGTAAGAGRLSLLALPPAVEGVNDSLRADKVARYTAQTQRLTGAITKLIGVASAAAVAASIGDIIGDAISSALFDNIKALKELEAARRKHAKDANEAAIEHLEDRLNKSLKLEEEHVQKVKLVHQENVANALDANDQIVQRTESALNKIVSAQQQRTNALKKIANESAREIERSIDRVGDLQRTIRNEEFERRLERVPDERKARALISQASEIARVAQRGPIGEEQIRQLEDAIGLAQRVRQIAGEEEDPSKRRREIARADNLIVDLRNQQLRIEREIQSVEEGRRQAALKAAAEEQQQTNRLKSIVKDIVGSLSFRDRTGGLIDAAEQEKNIEQVQAKFSELFELVASRDDVSVDELLNVASLRTLINQQLDSVEIQQLRATPAAMQGLVDQVASTEFQVRVAEQALADKTAESEAIKARDKAARAAIEAATENKALAQELADIQQTGLRLSGDVFVTDAEDQARKNAEAIIALLDRAAAFGTLTKSFIARVESVRHLTEGLSDEDQEAILARAFELSNKIASNSEKIETFNTQSSDALVSGAEKAVISYEALLESSAGLLEHHKEVLRTIQSQPSGAVGRQHGGLLYRAAGGSARGTDTIPAMLSPGEFVVNADSSRKFFSQLQAINAGVQPVFRNDGGSVNVTVGDINVQGGPTPRATGREIAQELGRQIRRGAIRKF